MDDVVDLSEQDAIDNTQTGIFTDFSQVKIEVHGPDVAERIIEDLADATEDQECLAYPDSDVEEIQEDYLEPATEDQECLVYPKLDVEEIQEDSLKSATEDQVRLVYPESDDGEMQEDYLEPATEDQERLVYSESNVDEEDYEEILPEDIQTTPEHIENYTQHFSEYAEVPIKEEPSDYADFDEVPYSDELQVEDYQFNNKIILGSKPCVSKPQITPRQEKSCVVEKTIENEIGYRNNVAKEYLDAIVFLEDWALKLENSTSFCKACEILFATPNALDAHNTSTHSFLVAVSKNVAVKSTAKPTFARKSTSSIAVKGKSQNIARKRTGTNSVLTSKFCNHCNMVFPDHTALIKHLYELLPLKQFKCNICDAVFNKQNDLIDHNSVHVKIEKPKVKKEKITNERTNLKRKLLYEEDVKKKRPVSPAEEVGPIPISALFQCTKCNLHLLSAFAGWQHHLNCSGNAGKKKLVACKICKRKLRYLDAPTHRKQHEICSKFKVYKVTKNLLERTLSKCPACGVHFKDITIKSHITRCGRIPTAHCQKCNILVPKTNLEVHSNIHTKQNLKPKDFIIVKFYIKNKSLKRKQEPIATPTKKLKLESLAAKKNKQGILDNTGQNAYRNKIKKEATSQYASKEEKKMGVKTKMVNKLKFEKGNKIRMYFCRNCNGCCVRDSRRTLHLSKKCKTGRVSERIVCEECGLQFNTKTILSHRRLHKKRQLTIHNIVFYDIGTLKRILPTMPSYPKCVSCKINFFNKHLPRTHICGEDYETCKFCGEKFHNSAYKIHLEFHKLVMSEAPRPKIVPKMMPELIKKYESLNMMWNIVYSCKKCDIVTDLYDKAVEHSQTHFKNLPMLKTIKCYICNLKFDETCWSKHSDLHSRMNINSKDFKILGYDPSKLLSEEWFQLFESLPEDQIRQITGRSLYGYERGVKMMLLKDGRSEFTLYSCSRCNVCHHHNEIEKHALTTMCTYKASTCKICSIKFCDKSLLKYHEILHLQGIQKEEFRVVGFEKAKVASAKKSSGEESAEAGKKRLTLENKYVLYKCTNCNSCIVCKTSIVKHQCLAPHRVTKCTKCNEYFHKSYMIKHKEVHKKRPDFNAKNIKIEYFESYHKTIKKNYATKNSVKVLKKPACGPKTKNRPEIASADTSKNDKTETKLAEVFKCDCGLHFTSKKTIERHMTTCSTDTKVFAENCSKCGLLFPTDVLVSHLCKHHSVNTKIIVIEDYCGNGTSKEAESSFDSVESTSETTIQKKPVSQKNSKLMQNYEVKLYKCSECNVYYMTQNTCYKHVYKFHQPLDAKQFIECKLCCLQFTIKTLPLHISKHHQRDFNLDTLLVEEYQPPVGKGPTKIDLYIAAEKLQSIQVTSSMEDGRFSNR